MTWLIDYLRERTKPGDGDCWLWTGQVRGAGRQYPILYAAGRRIGAHDLAFQVARGRALPAGYVLRNRCGNTCCINPEHWKAATRSEVGRTARKACGPKHAAAVTLGRRRISDLTIEKVRQLRAERAAGVKPAELAQRYGKKLSTVQAILAGRLWKEASPFPTPARRRSSAQPTERTAR